MFTICMSHTGRTYIELLLQLVQYPHNKTTVQYLSGLQWLPLSLFCPPKVKGIQKCYKPLLVGLECFRFFKFSSCISLPTIIINSTELRMNSDLLFLSKGKYLPVSIHCDWRRSVIFSTCTLPTYSSTIHTKLIKHASHTTGCSRG